MNFKTFLFLMFSSFVIFNPDSALRSNPQNIAWEPDILLSEENSDLSISTKRGKALCVVDNAIHAVWSSVLSDSNTEIYYRKSLDKGALWQNCQRLTNAEGFSMVPVIAANQTEIYVVWKDERNDTDCEIYFKRSLNNGTDWEGDIRLTDTPDLSNAPAFCVDGNKIYLAWEEMAKDPATCRVYFKSSQDMGATWSDQQLISDDIPKREDGAPSIGITDDDVIHVVYGSDKDAGATAGYNWENYYRRSTDGGASWEEPVRLTNDQIGDTRFPVIAVSGTTLHVVWWDDRADTSYSHYGYPPAQPEDYKNYEIYYKRSLDSGLTWEDDIRLTHAAKMSGMASIAALNDIVLVVWQDYRDDNYEIYLKYSLDGGTNWSEDIRATNDSYYSRSPSIEIDNSGVIYLLWTDKRSGKFQVYFKKSSSAITSVSEYEKNYSPLTFNLEQNYPNPFNASTTIVYQLNQPGEIEIAIYNLLGEKIKTIINENKQSGKYSIIWDGTDFAGKPVSSGCYFYQLIANNSFSKIKKMLLLK